MAFVLHVDVDQHLFGFFNHVHFVGHGFNRMQPERAVAFGKTRDDDVFKHRQSGKDFRCLKHPADAELVDFMRFLSQQRMAVEHHRAGIGDQFADKAVQQRGFASAIRADDGVNRAFFDGQVHIIQRLEAAKAVRDVPYF